ncbi:MAG: DUF4433 domain-containing protein [Xanthomonadaceae bacterium]|jgi:hypothetical protein|nr:DUF4433 domain-containing protein [Xanthomonadaceae bacterium]
MTAIYHITHVDNLPAILAAGALWSDSRLKSSSTPPKSIAHGNIKRNRDRAPVGLPPGGFVSDYVPFYFCPRSPMLAALHYGTVENAAGTQGDIVHLVLEAELLVKAGLECVHTDGHAAMQPLRFWPGVSGFAELPWDVIRSWSWKNKPDDNDRKRRKQAEFLVHDAVPWSHVQSIGVMTESTRDRTIAAIAAAAHRPPVTLQPDWYYR